MLQPIVVTDKFLLNQLVQDGLVGTDGVIQRDVNGLPFLSTRVPGARTAHNMGDAGDRGRLRISPFSGQVEVWGSLGGAGGSPMAMAMNQGQSGEFFGWRPWNPNTPGAVVDAWFYQRYGPNWNAGGLGTPGWQVGHTTEVRAVLEEMLGHHATLDQVYDIEYGVTTLAPPKLPDPTPGPTPTPTPSPTLEALTKAASALLTAVQSSVPKIGGGAAINKIRLAVKGPSENLSALLLLIGK